MTLAEHIVAALAEQGVERIFGIPGGGSSLDLIAAADAAGIDFVLTRGETAAAIMAAVTGELSGSPGVVLTGIGPGAASAVNGIAYAQLEQAPVLLFADGPASSRHQAFDQSALFAPISKAQVRLRPAGGGADLAAAIRSALAPAPGPVLLELTAEDAAAPLAGAREPAPESPPPGPDSEALAAARRLIARSRRPVVIAGLEARGGDGPAALARLTEALGGPALLTYKAKGVLPEAHANLIGLFTGARAEADCLSRADLIVLFGLDPVEMIPGDWRYEAPILELRRADGAPFPVAPACRIVGEPTGTLRRLLPAEADSDWTAAEIAALRRGLRARAALSGHGHTAQSVIECLCAAAPAGCRLTVDAGAHMFATLTFWRADEPFGVLKSNGLSTMGFALPAAIASALQEPARPVLAVTGDAGLMMCLSELATACDRGCRIVVVVLNDAALSLIDIKQQRQQRRRRGVAYPRVDFAAAARALGCRASALGPEAPLPAIIAEAFAGAGPALIDIAVDPSGYPEQLAALRG